MARRDRPSDKFLPPDPRVTEPYRFTPQLALRVGVLGAVALAVFAVLFLRLWALQVLSGDRYLNAAQENQVRTVRVEAPRGSILDRNGHVLVSNVPGTAVRIWKSDLPEEGRYAMFKRLSKVLRVPLPKLTKALEDSKDDPLTPITIKTAVHEDQVMYLTERVAEFPGVQIVGTYLRDYEHRALAAQILGYVGEISPDELAERKRDGYRGGDKLGKTGVERAFDQYLRGIARCGPGAGRLGGTAPERVPDEGVPDLRPERAADDRRRSPAGGGAGARVRDPDGEEQRVVQRERRRDRGARSHRRRDSRDGVEPDLQAVGLRRPGRSEEARAAGRRQGREGAQLPGPEPRARRPVSARLGVQAGHRARCDLGRAALAVPVDPVHADRATTGRTTSSSRTGTRTRTSR